MTRTLPPTFYGGLLLLCFVGVIWQWPSPDQAPDHAANARDEARGDSPMAPEKSTRAARSNRRSKASRRRLHFGFENARPGSTAAAFLQDHPDLAKLAGERREAIAKHRFLNDAGLGPKHPDLLALDEKIEADGKVIARQWSGYRSHHGTWTRNRRAPQ